MEGAGELLGHRQLRRSHGHHAGGGHERQLVDASGMADRHLRRDEAAHRIADDGGALDADLAQERVHEPAVAGHADVFVRQLGVAESGQVDRDHAMAAGEVGDVLEPVLPAPGQPVHEHERGAFAHLDVVHPRAVHRAGAQVAAPVDVEPLGAAVGPVAVGQGRELGDPRALLPRRRGGHDFGQRTRTRRIWRVRHTRSARGPGSRGSAAAGGDPRGSRSGACTRAPPRSPRAGSRSGPRGCRAS